MSQHTVRSFDEELAELNLSIQEMGTLVEHQYGLAVETLIQRDAAQANEVLKSDTAVDAFHQEIAQAALAMLALRQPVAVDFREAIAAVRITADLERIGDLSKDLAKRATAMGEVAAISERSLRRMSDLVAHHLHEVVGAYMDRDAGRAQEVWISDAEVDDCFHSLYRELLSYMLEDPRKISGCTHLLFGAKSIERIGDHCAKIADSIYYLVVGSELPAERPKGRDVALDPRRRKGDDKRLLKVMAWYDHEWGYVNRMIDLACAIAQAA